MAENQTTCCSDYANLEFIASTQIDSAVSENGGYSSLYQCCRCRAIYIADEEVLSETAKMPVLQRYAGIYPVESLKMVIGLRRGCISMGELEEAVRESEKFRSLGI